MEGGSSGGGGQLHISHGVGGSGRGDVGLPPTTLASEQVIAWLEAWLCTSAAVTAPLELAPPPDASATGPPLGGSIATANGARVGWPVAVGGPATVGRALLVAMHEALFRQLRREQGA